MCYDDTFSQRNKAVKRAPEGKGGCKNFETEVKQSREVFMK